MGMELVNGYWFIERELSFQKVYVLCTNRAKKCVRKKHGHLSRAHTRLGSRRPALSQGRVLQGEAVAPGMLISSPAGLIA